MPHSAKTLTPIGPKSVKMQTMARCAGHQCGIQAISSSFGGGLRLLCMLSELQGVCEGVTVEREKSILKQGAIQHLYGRLSGRLREGVNDASLLVSLHFAPLWVIRSVHELLLKRMASCMKAPC